MGRVNLPHGCTGRRQLVWRAGDEMNNDALSVLIGVIFGVAASIPTSLLIVAAAKSRPEQYRPEPRRPQRVEAEIIVKPADDRLEIPANLYLESINAINDKLASPDPDVRQLASDIYDAFKATVRPARP